MHSAWAHDEEIRISTYRTEHGAEVDFIVEKEGVTYAIEAKASQSVGKSDLTGLKSFESYFGKPHKPIVVYTGKVEKRIDEVLVLPWSAALKELGFGP